MNAMHPLCPIYLKFELNSTQTGKMKTGPYQNALVYFIIGYEMIYVIGFGDSAFMSH